MQEGESGLLISAITREDVGVALELLRAQFDEHAIEVSDEEILASIEGIFARPQLGDVLLLRRGQETTAAKEAVGLAFLTYSWTPEIGGMACWLDELYVRPAHRGAGLGALLLKAVIAHCRERGCCSVDLQVEHSHERVVSLYDRHGFREQPRRTFRLDLRDGRGARRDREGASDGAPEQGTGRRDMGAEPSQVRE
jgi:ribosomal protein S18 acetylase RimI-like enzyme